MQPLHYLCFEVIFHERADSHFTVDYFFLQEELRPYFSLPKVMDGLFALANKLFDINIEAADGFALVRTFLYCIPEIQSIVLSYIGEISFVVPRFGTVMLDFMLSKIPQTIPLPTFTLILIHGLLKSVGELGWMRCLLVVVYLHVMVLQLGCLLRIWCAIKHHLLATSLA